MFSFFNKAMSDTSKTFFDFKIKSINGDQLNLYNLKGKTILLVNVASNCGFTKQYDDLQELYENFMDKGLKSKDKKEKFKELAQKRVDKILKAIDLLGNCSNKYAYDYTEEEVKKIFKVINSRIKLNKLKFDSNISKKGFKL